MQRLFSVSDVSTGRTRQGRGMDAAALQKGQGRPFCKVPEHMFGTVNCLAAAGGLSFGYFSLAIQRKVTRPSGAKPCVHKKINQTQKLR